MNLIGEHTDYNGGLVLPVGIDLETRVWLRFRTDRMVRGASREHGEVREKLDAPPTGHWLDYARGVAWELVSDGRIPARGFDARVETDLPVGAGLSSSAALEAAFALALLSAAGSPIRSEERPALARLCQRAESDFVGVPCGLMDPYAVLCGRDRCAILLDCGSEEAASVEIPGDIEIVVFDTGVTRELREGGYAQRRDECERALEQAAVALARPIESLSSLRPGDLGAVGGRVDPIVFRRTRHVVSENARVREFAARIRAGDRGGAGKVLFASHESLRVDFEVTIPESDALVEDSRDLPGCLGSRMTGAGWGGCTLHLVSAGSAEAFSAQLATRFEARFERAPRHWIAKPAAAASVLETSP